MAYVSRRTVRAQRRQVNPASGKSGGFRGTSVPATGRVVGKGRARRRNVKISPRCT